jgi:hypothetical protein
MTITFAALGIPFPLFEAPISEASEYLALSQCALCGERRRHCFKLGVGDAIIVSCPQCSVQNGLSVSKQQAVRCRACGSVIRFPELLSKPLCVCYLCLRNGKAAMTKDTEFGMVSWEQAFAGVTHGLPGLGLNQSDFELVSLGSGWVGTRVPQEHLFELLSWTLSISLSLRRITRIFVEKRCLRIYQGYLNLCRIHQMDKVELRTPTYLTWQGERWLFCCKAPMVYLGTWEQDQFANYAPGVDGRALFDAVVEGGNEALWEGNLHDVTEIYVFRCSKCGRLRAHWDIR